MNMLTDIHARSRTLLLVEDDDEMARTLSQELTDEGWHVRCVRDGEAGLEIATKEVFDVLVVDRMLPGLDGLSLVAALRESGNDTPVLFLSAMGSIADRVAGLERGGGDYLVKPFAFAELNARINILARRSTPLNEATILGADDLVLNRLTREVTRGGVEIDLLPLEYRLLEFLLMNAGQVATRKMLLEKVWGFNFDPRTNIVETHISHLRRKIQTPDAPPLIATVRGSGYIIQASRSTEGLSS